MKGLLLGAVSVILLAGTSSAQSFKIYDLSNNDITNTTIQAYCDTANTASLVYNVKNMTGNALTSKARKEEVTMVATSSSSICYSTTCYGSVVYTSACFSHPANSNVALTCDYNPNHHLGASTIKYTVYNCANLNDSATFTIVYNATPAGIKNMEMNFNVSDPYPNPASTQLNFNYQISNGNGQHVHLTMHDLLGSVVKSMDITESSGTVRLDVSDLEPGMYFYTIESNNKALAVKKVIIKR